MTYISSRLSAVRPSASMAVSQAAKALRARGIDVIDLGLGEPDFPTPAHIIEAAHRAARQRADALHRSRRHARRCARRSQASSGARTASTTAPTTSSSPTGPSRSSSMRCWRRSKTATRRSFRLPTSSPIPRWSSCSAAGRSSSNAPRPPGSGSRRSCSSAPSRRRPNGCF